MKGSMSSGGFFKKTRSAKGSFSGAKGKGMKSGGAMLGGSSFHTFKQAAPSSSSNITKKALKRKK